MSEEQLGMELYKRLSGRRYLIVLDDMWSIDVWNMVKCFLPDDYNGSRIIVTTRISSVARALNSSMIQMNFLDEDKGWDLLGEKVFARERCPPELEEVGRGIVKNCKGLPLAIVVTGGLLANSIRSKDYWESIARDTNAFISNVDDMTTTILSLSYDSLPIHLKPCFLYMGVFPHDGEIIVSWLIKLRVAEGFIKQNGSKELEVIGEEYLDDLIGRNLINVHIRGLRGKVKSCKIHGHLRDMCLKEAHKEKFIHVPETHIHGKVQLTSNQRRISIHQSSSDEEYIPQIIDTLKSGSMGRSLICDVPDMLPLQNLRLLRVLKVNDNDQPQNVKYRLDDVFQLVNSRFIAVTTIKHPMFPSSVCFLWNLQILIVKRNADGFIVPSEIWEMTELRHLQFENKLYLPDPPSEQMNKRVVMKNLQTLKGVDDFRCSDEVVKRIPNIKKLKICNWRNFTGEFGGCHLKMLSLMNMRMIGSLPHLEVLKLKYDAFVGPEWLTVDREFCSLKYLEIFRCEDLVSWISESYNFPCLEHLFLHALNKLVEIPAGIGEIEMLQSIRLEHCSISAVISAKEILEERREMGYEDFRVEVLCFKNSKLESLASNGFQVEAW